MEQKQNNQAVAMAQPQANSQMAVSVKQMMGQANVKGRFAELLGKKAPGFISSVISVANSSVLRPADPQTVMNAAVIAATLDLPINPNLGFAYIVPYKNKGRSEAQFQMGYKGFIQLALRSGQYQTINTTEVKEGEIESEDLLTGEITFKKMPAAEREKAKVVGYAAYFRLLNGFAKTMYMTREAVEAHAKKYSQSYKYDKYGTSLWATMFDDMAKKTVLKLLLSKYGPLSIEMQQAITWDQSVAPSTVDATAVTLDEVEPQYVDNEPRGVEDIEEEGVSEAQVDTATGEIFGTEA